LEASQEKDIFEVLEKKYELLPNQISMWKAEAIRNLSAVFLQQKLSLPKMKFQQINSMLE
jgi:hypothetical protein